MKLKHLLILTFIIVSVIPILLSLNYINNYTASQHRIQIENNLSALSLIAKKRVLDVLDSVKDNTALISSRTQMRLSLEHWNRTGKQEYVNNITTIIRDASAEMTRLYRITVFDQNTDVVASTVNLNNIANLNKKPRRGMTIQLKQDNDDLLVTSITTLERENTVIGYLEVDFYADFIIDLINERTGLGLTGEILFSIRGDNGDAIFVHPLKYDRKAAFNRTVSKDRLDVPVIQALLGNEIILNNAPDYMEAPVLASTRYIPKQDWALVTKMSESEVNNIIYQSNEILMWLKITVVTISIILGLIFSSYISRPIEHLRKQTEELASGNFNSRVVPEGWKEAKQLAISYNKMAESLKGLNDDLNQKVTDRTKQLKKSNEKLKELSIKDPLTNLYNLRYFDGRLKNEYKRATRYKKNLVIVMLDIDHFKSFNDNWGHAVGDEVLIKLSNYLLDSLRNTDILGRIGGEEFCIILPEKSKLEALPIIEKIRIGISKLSLQVENKNLLITCSFGVAELSDNIQGPKELKKMADHALYKAKKTGRNKVIPYEKRIHG